MKDGQQKGGIFDNEGAIEEPTRTAPDSFDTTEQARTFQAVEPEPVQAKSGIGKLLPLAALAAIPFLLGN